VGYDFENADKIFYDKTVTFIEHHLDRHADKPFFAVLSTQIAHAPVLPAKEFRGKTEGGPRGDFVWELDVLVGRLLDKLDELDIDENTLVLFNSDNGAETVHYHRMLQEYDHDASGGWRGMKRDGWEGGHRVPFIARWPRAIPAGQASKQMTNTTDIFATLASIVGYELRDEDATESFDMLPVMQASPMLRRFIPRTGSGSKGGKIKDSITLGTSWPSTSKTSSSRAKSRTSRTSPRFRPSCAADTTTTWWWVGLPTP